MSTILRGKLEYYAFTWASINSCCNIAGNTISRVRGLSVNAIEAVCCPRYL